MIEIVEFKPEHIDAMDVQPAQRMSPEARKGFAAPFGDAWTGLVDGRPVGCAGVVKVWDGRGYAWALLGVDAKHHMKAITRAVRRGLETTNYRRIEMAVDAGFDAGCHWARMLGFELETPRPMRAYLPNGNDAWLYVRVRD
jgi:hypothetical protein